MLRTLVTLGVLSILVLASGACDSAQSPTAPTSTALAPDVLNALELGIQDEYRAEAIYQGVVNDFGAAVPFISILTAEQRHSAAVAQLYTTRGLAVPASQASVSTVPHFASVREACVAAAGAERDNIGLYDRVLTLALPDDVRQVFTNNRRASIDNHLPAFIACS
jgi:hypothetical protein